MRECNKKLLEVYNTQHQFWLGTLDLCVYINIDSRENNKGLSVQLHMLMLMLMMMRDMTWPRFPVVVASWFAATKSAGGAAAVGDLHSRHNNTRYTHKYALEFPFAEHLKLLR